MSSRYAAQLQAAGLGPFASVAHAAQFLRLERAWPGWAGPAAAPPRAWFVPGRVELLGKHTDYAGGRSLLCALERGFCLLAAPRGDGRLRLLDLEWDTRAEFDRDAPPPPSASWAIYPATVARRLARDFPEAADLGADIVFCSSLPRGAGMSSSSAFIVACLLAMAGPAGVLARLGGRLQWAEYAAAVEGGHDGVGTHGGSEDHAAILACEAGHWSQFRFCPIVPEGAMAAPASHALVVAVSGVAAAKTGNAQAAYNRVARRAAAVVETWNAAAATRHPNLAAVVAAHGVEAVGEALRRHPHTEFSSASLRARLDQFWQESEIIIPAAAAAAGRGDWMGFGRWVAQSQALAASGLENQVPETEALVASARALGATAASAFGGGFGGAVWALVERGERRRFCRAWMADYRARFAQHASNSLCFGSAAGPPVFELADRA